MAGEPGKDLLRSPSWSLSDEGEYEWNPTGRLDAEEATVARPARVRLGRPILIYIGLTLITGILFILFIVSAIRYQEMHGAGVDCAEDWSTGDWSACAHACPDAEVEELWPAEAVGSVGRGWGGQATLQSHVLREQAGSGRRCRRVLRAECARLRRVVVQGRSVCPRQAFPACCDKATNTLAPDWARVRQGHFYSLAHTRYPANFPLLDEAAEPQPCSGSEPFCREIE